MKRKHLWFGLALVLVILLVCMVSASAEGWTKLGNHLMYFDGETARTGTQSINGKIYYFSDRGFLRGNGAVQYIGETGYYINASDELQYGWQTVNSRKYYFDPVTGKALRYGYPNEQWLTNYRGDREVYNAWASWLIDGSYYVFNSKGVLQINSWDHGYYGNSEGKILIGYQKVKDLYYCFDRYGLSKSGFYSIDGGIHYFARNSKLNSDSYAYPEARGWTQIDSNWYFFDEYSGKMKTGIIAVGDHEYSLNSNGSLKLNGNTVLYDYDSIIGVDVNGQYLTGWQRINGFTYYFIKDSDGSALTGFQTVYDQTSRKNNYYFFDQEGKMQTSSLRKCSQYEGDEEKYYYFGADGKAVTGWKTLDGSAYYFSPYAYVGYHDIVDQNGNSYMYLFDQDGKMQTDLLDTDDDGDIRYFGQDGRAVKGWKTLGGYDYYFNTAAYKNGTYLLEKNGENHDYTFDDAGRVTAVDGVSVSKKNGYEPVSDSSNKVKAFVTRCYRIILSRVPETNGLNFWTEKLVSGELTAAEIIDNFVYSDEFQSRNLSYADSVEVLYKVMLDRASDPAGKAYWVSVLRAGNPFGAIINGFCNSDEFTEICAEYGIRPGSVAIGEITPSPAPAPVPSRNTENIQAFVARCYRIILSREPEQSGLDFWTQKLASRELTAAEIINNFVYSDEFRNKHLSYGDSVEVLYRVMLNRGSDPAGKSYWVSVLYAGNPFGAIINGFCNSDEFTKICAEYSITPGSVAVASVTDYAEPEKEEEPEISDEVPAPVTDSIPADERMEQANAFVLHCYQTALIREPGAEEADYYTAQILNGQMTAKDIARAFVFSQEFQGKWDNDTAFVRALYKLCLNREADAEGLAYWTAQLAGGESAAAVFSALTENAEFVQVCAAYGIPSGVDPDAIRTPEEPAVEEEEGEAAPAAPASEYASEEKVREFVSRFYRSAMGREPDEEGLAFYTGLILSGQAGPKDVAKAIILSDEFRGRMPGNEELVRILYRVYVGREADEEGLAGWISQLDDGVSLETILDGFAASEEFAAVVNGLK